MQFIELENIRSGMCVERFNGNGGMKKMAVKTRKSHLCVRCGKDYNKIIMIQMVSGNVTKYYECVDCYMPKRISRNK